MNFQERASNRFPGVSTVWQRGPGGSSLVWLAASPDRASNTPAHKRVLIAISEPIVTAAMRRIEEGPASDYANHFFCLSLYAYVLSTGTCWPNARDSSSSLQSRLRKTVGDREHESEILAIADQVASTSDIDTIEEFSWDYFFPGLPYHGSIELGEDMQAFRDAVLRGWQKRVRIEGHDISLDGFLKQAEAERFRFVRTLMPRAMVIWHDWLAYSLRAATTIIGETALAIAEDCTGEEMDAGSRAGFMLLYGADPLAGGTNLVFLNRILGANTPLKEGLHALLDLPLQDRATNDGRRVREKMYGQLASIIYLAAEIRDLDRERKRPVDRSIEEVADPVAQSSLDWNGEVRSAQTILHQLSETDRMILEQMAIGGRKPKEVASALDTGMTPKQISNRFGQIRARLARMVQAVC